MKMQFLKNGGSVMNWKVERKQGGWILAGISAFFVAIIFIAIVIESSFALPAPGRLPYNDDGNGLVYFSRDNMSEEDVVAAIRQWRDEQKSRSNFVSQIGSFTFHSGGVVIMYKIHGDKAREN